MRTTWLDFYSMANSSIPNILATETSPCSLAIISTISNSSIPNILATETGTKLILVTSV